MPVPQLCLWVRASAGDHSEVYIQALWDAMFYIRMYCVNWKDWAKKSHCTCGYHANTCIYKNIHTSSTPNCINYGLSSLSIWMVNALKSSLPLRRQKYQFLSTSMWKRMEANWPPVCTGNPPTLTVTTATVHTTIQKCSLALQNASITEPNKFANQWRSALVDACRTWL